MQGVVNARKGYLHNCQARTWLGVWCYKGNSEHNRQLKLALGCSHAAHSVDSDGDMAVYIGDICNGRVVCLVDAALNRSSRIRGSNPKTFEDSETPPSHK
jgi:hypothetical protein